MGLWPFACRDCGFEFHLGHGRLSVVSVVCNQVEVWSLVKRSPNESGMCECDREALLMRNPWPTRGCCAAGEKIIIIEGL